MADNPFASLIPQDQGDDPFAKLVPQQEGGNPFAALIPAAEPRPKARLTPGSLRRGMASVLPQQGVKPGVVPGVRRPEPAEPPVASAPPRRTLQLTPGVSPRTTANAVRGSLGGAEPQRTALPPLGTETVGRTPEGRPIIRNPDGSFSTERSITVTDPRINGGRPTNIPSMFQGREVPQELAVRIIQRSGGKDPETGRVLEGYDSIEEAVRAAEQRSLSLGAMQPDRPQARLTPGMLHEGMAGVLPQEQDRAGVVPGIRRPEPQPPLAPSLGGALVQGVAGGLAGFPESIAVGRERAKRGLEEQFDRIDLGQEPDRAAFIRDYGMTDLFRIDQYERADPVRRVEMRERIKPRNIEESPLFQAGQSLREAAARIAPVSPEHEGSFPAQVARGFGSTAVFIGTGVLGRVFRMPAAGVTAGTGAIASGAESFRDALGHGASFEDAYTASQLSSIVGLSEALPITRILDRFDSASGGSVRRLLAEAIKGGTEEALQESFQSVANSLIASKLVGYDPDRGLFTGTGDAAGTGFSVGALYSFLASALGAKMRRTPREFTEHVVSIGQEMPPESGRPAQPGPRFERGESVGPTEPPGPPPGPSAPPVTPAPAQAPAAAGGVQLPPEAPFNNDELTATLQGVVGDRFQVGISPMADVVVLKNQRGAPLTAGIHLGQLIESDEDGAPVWKADAAQIIAERIREAEANELNAPRSTLDDRAAKKAAAQLPPDIPRTVYRGFGRGDRGEVYGGAAVPILGEGRYSAFTREGAEQFGPNVEQGELTLSNPLVIRSDEEWRALTKEAGWGVPNPFGRSEAQVRQQTEALQSLLRQRGHDGVIVHWDDSVATDYDAQGRGIKLLRNVFGQPQAFELAGAQQQGQRPTAPAATPPAGSRRGIAITPRGRQVDTALEVVEADQLVTSHLEGFTPNPAFPPELQPRDRQRAASVSQITGIAANLEPRLLADSASAAEGAPIIGPDNIVESGNARTMALRQVYATSPAAATRYRDFLASQGFDVTGMRQPVLVRRRLSQLSPQDRLAFVREANERTTLDLSATERALADANTMPDSLLDQFRGGDINAAVNREFVRRWTDTVATATERGAMFTPEGQLSQDGLRRIENAIFARAYGDAKLLESIREATDTNIKGLGNALLDVSPRWAQMRSQAARDLVPPELDITASIKEALSLVREARTKDLTVGEMLRQGDLLGPRIDETTRAVLGLFFRDDQLKLARDWRKIAQALNRYAEQVMEAKVGPILIDLPRLTPIQVLKTATDGGQASLLDYVAGHTNDESLFSVTSSRPGPGVSEAAARPSGGGLPFRTVEGVAIFFPDDSHAALFDLASSPNKATARELFERFKGYVEGVRNPSDIFALARDYAAEVQDIVLGSKRSRGGQPDYARLVVDPDRQTRYVQRERLGASESEMSEMAFSIRPPQSSTLAATPGPNYVGSVPDRIAGTTPAEPIRREDIIADLAADLEMAPYFNRVKGKLRLGFFRPSNHEVRIRNWADLETIAHEFGHLLDKRFPEIRRQWLPATKANKAIREELSGISYDARKIYEGWAEFVRLWVSQAEMARQKAPRFYGWFEDFVARNEHGAALRRFQQRTHEYFGQHALARLQSKIGVSKEITGGLSTFWTKFRQSVFDDLHGIENMERRLTGDVQALGAYVTSRLTRGASSMVEGTLYYGAPVVNPDGSHGLKGRGLLDIFGDVSADMDRFKLYMVGRSAAELKEQGRERLFARAEIKAATALETPAFKKAMDDYLEWNNAVLDFCVAKGLINPASRRLWNRAQYIPFHRTGSGRAGQALPGLWNGIKPLRGGTENIKDPITNIVENSAMIMQAALANEARLKVADMAMSPGGAAFMTRIPTDEKMVAIRREEVERAIKEALGIRSLNELNPDEAAFIDSIMSSMGPLVQVLLHNQAPHGSNVVSVLRDGKPEFYEVNDWALYRAYVNITRIHPQHGAARRFLSWTRHWGQAFVTVTPTFMVKNLVRDTTMASVISENGYRPFVEAANGFKSAILRDPTYKEFLMNGGGFSSYLLREGKFEERLRHFYIAKGIEPATVLGLGKAGFRILERAADGFEMASRLGEFKRARARGLHLRQAAFSGREISSDFGKRGGGLPLGHPDADNFDRMADFIGWIYDSVIFTKAAMNGLERAYVAGVKSPKRRAVWAKAGALALLSMALYTWNKDIEDYQDLPAWDRDLHWHVYWPTMETLAAWSEMREPPAKEGDRYTHLRIPKAFEVGGFASIAERTAEALYEGEPEALPGHVLRILHDVVGVGIVPQAVEPILEIGFNRDFFTSRPIETRGEEELEAWARGGPGTSRFMRAIGESTRDVTRNLPEMLQLSPPQLEHLIEGYFNAWGAGALMAIDTAIYDDIPNLRVEDYPILSTFYRSQPARHTKYEEEFYEMYRAARQAQRTMKQMDIRFRPEIADELEADERLEPENQLELVAGELSGIRRETRQINDFRTLAQLHEYANQLAKESDKTRMIARLRLSPEWRDIGALKRELLDFWTVKRSTLVKETVLDIRKQQAGDSASP